MDEAAYGEEDLTGLRVSHATGDFEEGEDVVLTLKDSRVLAGEGMCKAQSSNFETLVADESAEDELQNVNMVENEAIKAVKERKRKAQATYTGYDDEEFDESRIGQKAEILSKYDDEFASGKAKAEGFRLGAATDRKPVVDDEDTEMVTLGHVPATKVKLSMDFTSKFPYGHRCLAP